ncbi:hypothetical protein Sa4125_25020 [Aureimonas sp. SA4125]|uniref:YmfQ family protein n=1 Tax=Aureimonas sp. SA4125 TaxID=2826993 RepID=UPI001CC7A405|nr:YmfQ family protein [Aureimonas sp. SA4125]BDA84960.1 hypothetical protein Sa4125_25020 [Aureimonas sp. SA4125]
MRDPGLNTRTVYAPELEPDELTPPAPGDALSDPSVEDLLPGGLAMLPRGAAWGTPDGVAASTTTTLAGLMRTLLSPYTNLYTRLFALTYEARATTLVDSLTDWERDFGLPDACSAFGDSLSERRAALITKVR